MNDKSLHDMYHFYDVVRIDEEEKSGQVSEKGHVFGTSPCLLFI